MGLTPCPHFRLERLQIVLLDQVLRQAKPRAVDAHLDQQLAIVPLVPVV